MRIKESFTDPFYGAFTVGKQVPTAGLVLWKWPVGRQYLKRLAGERGKPVWSLPSMKQCGTEVKEVTVSGLCILVLSLPAVLTSAVSR